MPIQEPLSQAMLLGEGVTIGYIYIGYNSTFV